MRAASSSGAGTVRERRGNEVVAAGILQLVVNVMTLGSLPVLGSQFLNGRSPSWRYGCETLDWEARRGLGAAAAGICGGLVCGLAAGVAITLLSAAAVAAPPISPPSWC